MKHGGGFPGFHVLTWAGGGVGFEIEDFSVHGDDAVIFPVKIEGPVFAGGEEPGCKPSLIDGVDVLTESEKHVLHHVPCVFEFSGVVLRETDEGPFVALQGVEEDAVYV